MTTQQQQNDLSNHLAICDKIKQVHEVWNALPHRDEIADWSQEVADKIAELKQAMVNVVLLMADGSHPRAAIVNVLDTTRETRCVLCGKVFTEFGNNPYPLAKKGQCCNECNGSRVLPARLASILQTAEMANQPAGGTAYDMEMKILSDGCKRLSELHRSESAAI